MGGRSGGNTQERNAAAASRYVGSKLAGSPPGLYDAARHLITHGGKRLRPHMVMQSCRMLGGRASDAMAAAGAVEMIHNFTLVHDDIMDNDEMRHGVLTVHKKFGLPVAILAGDVLFSKAFQSVAGSPGISPDARARMVSRLADACVDVCEGQMLDIRMGKTKRIPSEAEYIEMVGKKTAALFEVSCAMGAICATDSGRDIANLSAFGRNLGIAFQITDDLIGVMGDPKVTKKPVGNDLREGKKSLPILMAIRASRGRDKKIITKAFGNPRVSAKDLGAAVGAIRSLGIEEDVRERAVQYADRAEKSLKSYSGKARDEMVSMLDFVVRRSV